MNALKQILILGRLRFLSISISLYTLGALLAMLSGAEFSLDRFLLGYLVLMLGHLSVHYSNDYFDYQSDLLGKSCGTSGGSGVLTRNPELLELSKRLAIMLAAASILLAAVFTAVYAFPLAYLAFAILGNLVSWYYTAPPLRLAYKAYGVLASTFAVGFLMPAIGNFSLFGGFSPLFIVFALPLALQALAFLISVQIPDAEADRAAGKYTFVAMFGGRAGFLAAEALLAMMALYYAVASFLLKPLANDLKVIALLSLLPLGIGAIGIIKGSVSVETDARLVKYGVICYVISTMLLCTYLAARLFHFL